jgi:hypothetical protein
MTSPMTAGRSLITNDTNEYRNTTSGAETNILSSACSKGRGRRRRRRAPLFVSLS